MMTAIDFGCHTIRAASGNPERPDVVQGCHERSEYVVLPATDRYQQMLEANQIGYAECEDSFVVFGNKAGQVKWLSRLPSAPLFLDGQIPTADAPARQILNVITAAMLKNVGEPNSLCCFTSPGGKSRPSNVQFLSKLLTINQQIPLACSATDALILANGHATQFTGISMVFGAEVCELGVSRFGIPVATDVIPIGSNWIDAEMARQGESKVYDASGDCYLDIDAIRSWKVDSKPHLRNSYDEQGRRLSRLYGVVLDRVAASLKRLMQSSNVRSALGDNRLNLLCGGGAIQVDGFTGCLTEKLVEHGIAENILSIQCSEDAETAVLRGLLIFGQLEQQRDRKNVA
ncbi:MAG: hypothetical protein ABJZ55_19495 [Fuerstiella sp.]